MITIIPINPEYVDYAQILADEIIVNGCDTNLDLDFHISLNSRHNYARNFIVTIGHNEIISNTVTLRDKSNNIVSSNLSKSDFVVNWRDYVTVN